MSLPANELAQAIRDNQGLIYSLAIRYSKYGVAVEDLVQEGNMGLLEAASRFDPERGLRFMTYATFWVRALILKAVERHHFVYETATRKVFWKGRYTAKMRENAGLPTDEESLAKDLGVKPYHVRKTFDLMAPKAQLDNPDTKLHDRVAADTIGPEDLVANAEDRYEKLEAMKKALKKLRPRYRQVLEMYHLSETPATLQEIADKMGVSRERVRQVNLLAIKEMRKYMKVA